jgi:hypothetical protein
LTRSRSSLAKRLAWFVLLWAAGVAAVAAVGAVLKVAIGG